MLVWARFGWLSINANSLIRSFANLLIRQIGTIGTVEADANVEYTVRDVRTVQSVLVGSIV